VADSAGLLNLPGHEKALDFHGFLHFQGVQLTLYNPVCGCSRL
jgi:hypothetical protein